MLYRPALHGNWNALSLARRALKDKFPTPAIPLTTVLQNRQVFMPDPLYETNAPIQFERSLQLTSAKTIAIFQRNILE
jgi:hypothetical protein